jgi:hypothetical protein
MPLCTEPSNAHLTVATDCTVSCSRRSNGKDAGLGKCGATVLHLSAAQKFLSEVTGLLYEM